MAKATLIALTLLWMSRVHFLNACSVSASDLNFGTYNPADSSNNDSTFTLTVSCNESATYSISLSKPVGSRVMVGAGDDSLIYNIYTDMNRQNVWGDGTGGTHTVDDSISPPDTYKVYTFYGRLIAGQDKSSGTYSDTLTVTVTY